MSNRFQASIWSTGLAMFSMFFGAGNVVFPLAAGRLAGDMNFYAIAGLLLTAVTVPLLGLIGMILFDGNYNMFFGRVGKVGGYFLSFLVMSLIGPVVAIPRCVALSHATLKMYLPGVSLFMFSFIACALIFLLTVRKTKILDLLGYVLSPLLLISLIILIVKGFIGHPMPEPSGFSASEMFLYGLKEGYNTLDLFAAFFFSTVVLVSLRRDVGVLDKQGYRELAWFVTKAGGIAAVLLGSVYTGFSYIASFYAPQVSGAVGADEFLGALAPHILGNSAGFIGNAAVALACLTTAITLAAVFADFVQKELLIGKIDYSYSLLITVFTTFAMANLGFSGLMSMMAPAWFIFYPVLIVLSIVNIAKRLFDFKPVKTPVAIALIASVVMHFWG